MNFVNDITLEFVEGPYVIFESSEFIDLSDVLDCEWSVKSLTCGSSLRWLGRGILPENTVLNADRCVSNDLRDILGISRQQVLTCKIIDKSIILNHLGHLRLKFIELMGTANCNKVCEGDIFLA